MPQLDFGFHSGAPKILSIRGMEHVVWLKIAKEVVEGWVIGSFPSPSVPNLWVSPLGIVPKKALGNFT